MRESEGESEKRNRIGLTHTWKDGLMGVRSIARMLVTWPCQCTDVGTCRETDERVGRTTTPAPSCGGSLAISSRCGA